jgi:hypothetical protein
MSTDTEAANPQYYFASHTPLRNRAAVNEQKRTQTARDSTNALSKTNSRHHKTYKQRNVDVMNTLNRDTIVEEIRNYQHANRMENILIPKLALLYQPHGKGDIDRPRRNGENSIV